MISATSPSLPNNGLKPTRLTRWVWAPQVGPQKALVDCPFGEVFFGGARGGGKTDGVLGKWALKERLYGENFNAVAFRRTSISFEDAIERAKQIYLPLGASFSARPDKFRMPNGGRVSFAYLESVDDAQEYQGRNITDAWVEEAGQYPHSGPIDRLFGVLRSAAGVPVQLILTANPGGPGQGWLADRYKLIPFPQTPELHTRHLPNGAQHQFAVIPSRLKDNPILLKGSPNYADRLQMVGSPELVKAWLEGDWNAIEGAFFPEWSAQHVLPPTALPDDWLRFRSCDWGSASPFSVGWWAVAGDDTTLYPGNVDSGDRRDSAALEPGARTIPRGALVRYREWYGASKPGVGLKLTAEEVADGIRSREADEKIAYGVLDPAAFAEDGGPSIGQRMALKGVHFRPADNKRVGVRGAMGGWDMLRARLKGTDGRPMLYVFSTCRDFIRTVPRLEHDQDRPEDLDTTAEDHVADEARYACMSRPWIPRDVPQPKVNVSGYRIVGARPSSEVSRVI